VRKQAWIHDPKTANTARFDWDPKNSSQEPWYFVDSGRHLTGAPPPMKTRWYTRLNDHRKLWLAHKERATSGWRSMVAEGVGEANT
jgi:hypothetical protein